MISQVVASMRLDGSPDSSNETVISRSVERQLPDFKGLSRNMETTPDFQGEAWGKQLSMAMNPHFGGSKRRVVEGDDSFDGHVPSQWPDV
jgi:hypothetical protein